MKRDAVKKIIKETLSESDLGEKYFSELYNNAPNTKFVDNILTYLRNNLSPKEIELLIGFVIDETKKDIPDWDIYDWYLLNGYIQNVEHFKLDSEHGIEKDLY